MFGLEMNDVQECPSLARLKTHRAHGVICPVCEPTEERRVRCPVCRCRVAAVGPLLLPHAARSQGLLVRCPGSRTAVDAGPVREKPFRWGRVRRRVAGAA
jgi:hypothetical protein